MLTLSQYLAQEWRPALGCTEPACIAYAASLASQQAQGDVRNIHLRCDPRIYKNCYAVGIPHSQYKTGIQWALAIGSLLPDPSAQLEIFRQIDDSILKRAGQLVDTMATTIEVDSSSGDLLVDCQVVRSEGTGRVVIQYDHTNVTTIEKDGQVVAINANKRKSEGCHGAADIRKTLAQLSFEDLFKLSQNLTAHDHALLRQGIQYNIAIAEHGLTLFPPAFMDLMKLDPLTRISRLVCAGVYARMSGENYLTMSLAGSGNKGIVAAVPLALWGREHCLNDLVVEKVLAFACLVTSATTHYLGSLSAACGCSNAAGIGLAAGLVLLQGGSMSQVAMAVNNIVGNVTGMICDGAKMGCGLKTMTSVDAAFRAASLALNDIGIPATDGILGQDIETSLINLGRVTNQGMMAMDDQILQIMQAKLRAGRN